MNEYHKLLKFKYKNNIYIMYLDGSNKHFFLKADADDNLYYITTSELFELTKLFTSVSLYMKIERSKFKFVPKIINGGLSVILSTSMLTSCVKAYNENTLDSGISEDVATQFVSSSEESKTRELIVDTYREGQVFGNIYIYDMDYLDKVFEPSVVTLEDLYSVIENNNSIPFLYKKLLFEYCNSVFKNYPNIDFRVFKENLKTLKIIEYDKEQLYQKLGSENFYGAYAKNENAIYVLKENTYEKGTWEYQVIFHEFSHCLRTGIYENKDGKDIHIEFEGKNYDNKITSEALNSLFAVSLFDYQTDEISYQLQSNYHSVMLECMDNYDLSDYINHSQSYFAKKLDEYNGGGNYSTVILDLIKLQYDDYHSSEIEVNPDEYYPIYDYITNMYLNKYVTSDMTYQEAYDVTTNLINKITYGVSADYNIDYNYFYQILNSYCNNMGIDVVNKTR